MQGVYAVPGPLAALPTRCQRVQHRDADGAALGIEDGGRVRRSSARRTFGSKSTPRHLPHQCGTAADHVFLLPDRQVAVHLVQDRATAVRDEIGSFGVLDRVRGDDNDRAARQAL